VAGFDLTCKILDYLKGTEDRVFLFGAKPGVAEIAKQRLEKKYPGLKVVGTNDGYFTENDIPVIIEKINESGAKLLLVCLGAKKQEKWINDYQDKLTTVRLCMGVGGTLDVFAGNVKRAPKIFIKLNLEWLYRLLKQPSRIGRFAALPKFIVEVVKSKKGMKKK
ncbi:MAG: WecB/TagA/CpsF family glycosyltransferase, partial [Clostridia bacterium]|nr:WecB/TagA/CpsF family glycosyltransferase [Clostridia bacterium]